MVGTADESFLMVYVDIWLKYKKKTTDDKAKVCVCETEKKVGRPCRNRVKTLKSFNHCVSRDERASFRTHMIKTT